jgi:GNAT superfamily N-acetyltransferase
MDVVALVIERVHDQLSDAAGDLLSESEQAGSRIVRRLVEEWATGANRFDRPGEALFGGWARGRLVGVCGLNVDPYARDERVGRVRHLYVLSAFRRLGVGRQLVTHVIESARRRFDHLRLRTDNPAAARLYESLGFRPRDWPGDSTHAVELVSVAPNAKKIQ